VADQIRRTCELDATPAAVWQAITDSSWLRSWLAEEVELELRPGGEARFVVDGQERTGWVEEALTPAHGRPGRLSFWWQCGDAPASRVAFELEPSGSGTRLHLTESRPLEALDLVGTPLRGTGGMSGDLYGPALVAA